MRSSLSELCKSIGIDDVHTEDDDRAMAVARSQLDDPTFAAMWAAGRSMTLEQAIAYAMEVSGGMWSSQRKRMPPQNEATDQRGRQEGQIATRQHTQYTTGRRRSGAKGAAMALDTQDLELKLIRRAAGVELDLEPLQGSWTETQYLMLTNQTNHLIEFTDGVIEVLPMPTDKHQMILRFVLLAFMNFVEPLGGRVLFAPLRVQVRPGKYREPDLLLVLNASDPRRQDEFWLGADLVVEIVSPDRPKRDIEEKPRDYAEAGIPEYWIVNPLDETVTVLTLDGDAYSESGVFRRGESATSALLEGFAVRVDEVFDAS